MYRKIVSIIVALTMLILSSPYQARANDAFAESQTLVPPQSNTLLIGVQPGLSEEQVAAQITEAGFTLVRYWPRFNVAEAVAPNFELPDAMAARTASIDGMVSVADALSAGNPQFRYVGVNQPVFAASAAYDSLEPPKLEPQPDDPRFGEQYAVGKVKAVDSWNITHGDSRVVIGVIDSGYQADHPDIDEAHVWTNLAEKNGIAGVDDDGNGYVDDFHGWDWYWDDNMPDDADCGHGAHVLGTIAATTNNSIGVSGVGRDLVVAPLKMLGSTSCSGTLGGLLDAIDYAIDQEMDVISMSLTTYKPSNNSLLDAVRAAESAGIMVVAAAGNQNSQVLWPAAYPEVIAVAATDAYDNRWVDSLYQGSNYGPEIEIAAPGSRVLSTYNNSSYASLTGTSMATPHVSALLGLLQSMRPDLSADQLIDIMKASAEDVNAAAYPGDDNYIGAGRVNYYQALLDATKDLQLKVTPTELDSIAITDTLALQIEVKTPVVESAGDSTVDSLPISNAMVNVQVSSVVTVSGQTSTIPDPSLRTRVSTDTAGKAAINMPGPSQVGEYMLRLQVGSSYTDLPFSVVDPPEEIRLDISSNTMTVGDESINYLVRLFEDGKPLSGEKQIRIETTVGYLEGGGQSLDAIAVDGVFTSTLYSGYVSRWGSLTASVGPTFARRSIHVQPGPPDELVLVQNEGFDIVGNQYVVTFTATVLDSYGNAAADGTSVNITSTAGVLSAQVMATVSGSGEFDLRFPLMQSDAITVTAVVQGTFVTSSLEVLDIPTPLYLPYISTN